MKLSRDRATRPRRVVLALPLAVLGALAFASGSFAASPVPLGDAATFGALSATAMTNAGAPTVVNGDIGSSTSIDADVTNGSGSKYLAGSPELANAQASLLTAYGVAAAATPDKPTITGSNLAGRTLLPGVYNSSSSILISGPTALTLDGNGDPGSVFIFQAGSDLTVDPTSSVALTNGAQACNVFWQVGSSAFLKNSGFTFTGTILALTQITLTDNITVNGRLLARNADVTFIHDTVNTPSCASSGGSGTSGSGPSTPARGIYCDAAGTTYDLEAGQEAQPPYDKLGLVPAYVDPVSGAKSCRFPVTATPAATPATPPIPTATPPATTTAAAAAKAAAAKVAAAKAAAAKAVKAVAAKKAVTAKKAAAAKKAMAAKKAAAAKKAGGSTQTGYARPPVRPVGLTG